jgi:hypothetical protein
MKLRFAATLALAVHVCAAENWPGWRGSRGDGTSLETHNPVHWSTTSNVVWQMELPGLGHASPVSANGLVCFISDEGVTTVVKPGPRFEAVARNELGETVFASPALSQGQIYIRVEKSLFCIGNPVRAAARP